MGNWANTPEFIEFIEIFGTHASDQRLHPIRPALILGGWPEKQAALALRKLPRLFSKSRPMEQLERNQSDILFFSSSDKPNVQPAMNWFATDLVERDWKVCWWGPNGVGQKTKQIEQITNETYVHLVPDQGYWLDTLRILPFCFTFWLRTLWIILRARQSLLRQRILKNKWRLLLEIILAEHRALISKNILEKTNPKVLFTNGEQTDFGSALTIQAKKQQIHTIWFFNEWPTAQQLPVISDEIFVWNQTVEESLGKLIANNNFKPQVTIIGNAQLDDIDKALALENSNDSSLPVKSVAFLSEFIPQYASRSGTLHRSSVELLCAAAKTTPSFAFCIKGRPNKDPSKIFELCDGIDTSAIELIPGDVTITDLLTSDKVHAIVANSSSGLLLAAASGKRAFRLVNPENFYSIETLDIVVDSVSNASDLISALKAPRSTPSSEYFPFRGSVRRRVVELLDEKLGKSNLHSGSRLTQCS